MGRNYNISSRTKRVLSHCQCPREGDITPECVHPSAIEANEERHSPCNRSLKTVDSTVHRP